MKQVKINDVLKVMNCVDKNHLCSRLMSMMLSVKKECERNNNEEMAQYYDDIWSQLYDLLDEIGYYDRMK